jgi:hypothetical protein
MLPVLLLSHLLTTIDVHCPQISAPCEERMAMLVTIHALAAPTQ